MQPAQTPSTVFPIGCFLWIPALQSCGDSSIDFYCEQCDAERNQCVRKSVDYEIAHGLATPVKILAYEKRLWFEDP